MHSFGLTAQAMAGPRILLTAAEAYPELERAFLSARREIWASFRVFDLSTKLRSPEARRVGTTWCDLIVDTLRRGVRLYIVVTDFDPIAWLEGHRATWRTVRMFSGAAELSGRSDALKIVPAMHPARTGLLARLAFWPVIQHKLRQAARTLNDLPSERRRAELEEMPGLQPWIVEMRDGRFRPRYRALPPLCPATHHQKLAVFDRERVYIGGLDLDERRFDTPDHERESAETWHDVQILLNGPVAQEAQSHLESFLDVTAGKKDPPPQRRLLRTLSRPRKGLGAYLGPQTIAREILTAHERMADRAERLIYIETQYFRDRKFAHTLANLARARPDLGMLLVLPAAPDDVAFEGNQGLDARFGEFLQARSLRILRNGFRRRLFVASPAQPRLPAPGADRRGRDHLRDAPIVYIHAKVSIFDEREAIISSANLNGRSLKWDTEAGVLLDTPQDVAELRRRVMEHWLPADAGPDFFDSASAVSSWRNLALANAHAAPDKRKGFILPHDLKAAEKFGVPVPILPDEMV